MSFQAPLPTHNIPTIWHSKSALVMAKRAPLPERCVKCNAPTRYKLKRNLRWHHPALYLVIFAGVLLYFILSLVLSKSATVHVGLCETHVATRKRDMLITCVLVLLSFGCFFLAAAAEEMTFLFVGIFVLLGAIIYGIARARVVSPQKIDDHYVWLAGVDDSYLNQFPEWRAAR